MIHDNVGQFVEQSGGKLPKTSIPIIVKVDFTYFA
jgi:hypothetical protein